MLTEIGSMNYIAILVASVVVFLLGWLWFSPVLFGNIWMKLNKISSSQMKAAKAKGMKGMMPQMLWGFLSTVVMVWVLNMVIEYSSASTIMDAVSVSFFVWLGFIATTMLGMVLWERKPFALYVITSTHYLVSLIIAGIILVMW